MQRGIRRDSGPDSNTFDELAAEERFHSRENANSHSNKLSRYPRFTPLPLHSCRYVLLSGIIARVVNELPDRRCTSGDRSSGTMFTIIVESRTGNFKKQFVSGQRCSISPTTVPRRAVMPRHEVPLVNVQLGVRASKYLIYQPRRLRTPATLIWQRAWKKFRSNQPIAVTANRTVPNRRLPRFFSRFHTSTRGKRGKFPELSREIWSCIYYTHAPDALLFPG